MIIKPIPPLAKVIMENIDSNNLFLTIENFIHFFATLSIHSAWVFKVPLFASCLKALLNHTLLKWNYIIFIKTHSKPRCVCVLWNALAKISFLLWKVSTSFGCSTKCPPNENRFSLTHEYLRKTQECSSQRHKLGCGLFMVT